jgi:RNA polymerase sigma factor FliA
MSKTSCHPRTRPLQHDALPLQVTAPPFLLPQMDADLEQNDLVRLIAWQIFSRVPRHASVEVNDVIQAGYLGLLRARRTYRAECDVPFPIYARYRIRGEILDMLRRLDSAPRSLRRWQRAVEMQTRELSLRLQRMPTDEELSDTLGIEISRVRRNRQMLANASRDCEPRKRADEDLPGRGRESVATADWMPDVIQERKESFELLIRSLEKLAPRARRVVLLYYRQNMTMKQIGTLLQVNESRISQIHKSALRAMSAMIQAQGVRRADTKIKC